MIAWACFWHNDWEWSILILAETRGKAKAMFLSAIREWEFTAVRTQRQPRYDGSTDKPKVMMENRDIPEGYPEFYLEKGEIR